jgi:hypothetical protein
MEGVEPRPLGHHAAERRGLLAAAQAADRLLALEAGEQRPMPVALLAPARAAGAVEQRRVRARQRKGLAHGRVVGQALGGQHPLRRHPGARLGMREAVQAPRRAPATRDDPAEPKSTPSVRPVSCHAK